jgi:tyrosyl-tRNA synthetase
VELVHGEKEAKYAELQHRLIYAKNIISPEEYAAVQAENAALQRSSTTSGSVGLDNAPAEGAHLNNRPSPHVKLPRSAVEQANIGRILLACGLVQSSTEGHHLADVSAVHVGGFTGESKNRMPMHDSSLVFTPIKRWEIEDAKKYMIDDSLLIFRRGKHNIKVIEVVPDSEYEKLGLTYPGVRKRISEGE